jgi:hypothetical protein
MGAGKLARLLRRAKLWLEVEYELRLEVRRPFRKGKAPDPGACLRLLAEHLGRGGTAAIVGTETHWTVVGAVSGKRLLLADSHDRRYFRAAKALGDAAAASRLQPPGTFLLMVRGRRKVPSGRVRSALPGREKGPGRGERLSTGFPGGSQRHP